MGRGQHRNQRGAHPRPAPHKHGGVSGTSNGARAATQLIPPTIPTTAVAEHSTLNAEDDEIEGDSELPASTMEFDASRTNTQSEPRAVENEVEAAPAALTPQPATQEARHSQPKLDTPEAESAGYTVPIADDALNGNESGAPSRGRFYAPGQTRPRFERVERTLAPLPPVAYTRPAQHEPPAEPAPPATPPARRMEHTERIERLERAPTEGADSSFAQVSHPSNDTSDDEAEYTGPRSDVRGSVGGLIDSLHEVFARDRAIATQGGVARCGVCYLHFPTDELIYREEDGFYVCESCAHALGPARVPMVRRQQRQ